MSSREQHVTMLEFEDLPSECIQHIFSFLEGKDLFKCRKVCIRWQNEVDGYVKIESAWRLLCERALGDPVAARAARVQAGLPWKPMFESLALWPRVRAANFKLTVLTSSGFRRVVLLPNGTLGVAANHRVAADPFECRYCDTILYYCTDTLAEISRLTFPFLFSSYSENEKFIVVVHEDRRVCIIPKSTRQQFFVGCVPMSLHVPNDVFSLLGDEVYFQGENDLVHVARLIEEGERSWVHSISIVAKLGQDIVAFSCLNKKIYILTYGGNVYQINNGKYEYLHTLNKFRCNIPAELAKYGFQWSNRVITRWIHRYFNKNIWIGEDSATFCAQGKLVLMGTSHGLVHFVYPVTFDGLKINKRDAHFTIYINKILNMYPPQEKILQLDIVEKMQGHKIIVFMTGRVMVLEMNAGPHYAVDRVALTRMFPEPPMPLEFCLCLCHSSAVAEDARPLVLSAKARTLAAPEAMVNRAPRRNLGESLVVHILQHALNKAISQTRKELGHSLGKRAMHRRASERLATRAKRARARRELLSGGGAPQAARRSARLAALTEALNRE